MEPKAGRRWRGSRLRSEASPRLKGSPSSCGSIRAHTPLWKARTKTRGYWFAKSAAYLNGNPETPVYNGTTVANDRITSSRDVTVTRYNAMDVQRQMKVDFVNVGTLMAGQIEKTRRLSESETPTALENCFFSLYMLDEQDNKRYYAGRESGTPFGDWTARVKTRRASNPARTAWCS